MKGAGTLGGPGSPSGPALPAVPFTDAFEPFVVDEGESWRAVFKPAGLHCVPAGARAAGGGSPSALAEGGRNPGYGDLVDWYGRLDPEAASRFAEDHPGPRPDPGLASGRAGRELGLLNRLDSETSGLVIFARDPDWLAALVNLQKSGSIAKRYRLRAYPARRDQPGASPGRGCPEGASASWEKWFALPEAAALSAMAAATEGGLRVCSAFRPYGPRGASVACLRTGAEPPASLKTTLIAAARGCAGEARGRLELDAVIRSGFRHQIRAHMAWIGLPLDGDRRYGGAAAGRLYLEAYGIDIPSPDGGTRAIRLYPDLEGPAAA